MAESRRNNSDNIWPLPKFYFLVDLGNGMKDTLFQEVSGLETETQVIEYRHDNNAAFSTVRMPGIAKHGNVTLKKGVFAKDNNFQEWYNKIIMNTTERTTIVIKLLDEVGKITMQWTLTNAWPTKVTSTDVKDDGNEVAVELMEIAYEELTISNGGS